MANPNKFMQDIDEANAIKNAAKRNDDGKLRIFGQTLEEMRQNRRATGETFPSAFTKKTLPQSSIDNLQPTTASRVDFSDEKIEISFNLERQSIVNIKITDLLGNEPFALLNESIAPGEFKRIFNIPIKLAKGVYFIKVNAGNELIIRRISIQ